TGCVRTSSGRSPHWPNCPSRPASTCWPGSRTGPRVTRSHPVAGWRAHLETWRPYTLWYVGLVGLAGAALVAGPHHPWRLLGAWAAPTLGWLGGHYLGDYFDRELDAGSKPHRPIPSGRLAARTALLCGAGCFAALAVLALIGGPQTSLAA